MRRTLLATALALLALAAPAQAQDIAEQLEAIPGMTVVEEKTAPAPYRYFVLTFTQPNDHLKPHRGTFEQRLTVLHRGTDRPTVLHTSGYNVSTSPGRSEPTRLVDGNQISTEQRFFAPSRPASPDWQRQLTIYQAASDHHRIVNALETLYRGNWLSTGASKGGMTSIYHRRFFPDDVDGTVAYVAPNDVVNEEDSRYTRFFEQVGTPECRAALTALEREALGPRRAELLARLQTTAATEGWTFANTIGTADRSLEMTVLDFAWAFWQYGGVDQCGDIPPATASTDEIYAYLDGVVGWSFYTDQGLEPYIPYYFQAGTQLGYPVPSFARLRGLTRYRGLYQPREFLPRSLKMRFEPWRMRDIDRFVRQDAGQLLFVYGENDPWGAEPFELGRGTFDSYWYEAAGANHGANISRLTPSEQAEATAALQRWAGVAPAARSARTARAAVKIPRRIRGFDRNDALIRRP